MTPSRLQSWRHWPAAALALLKRRRQPVLLVSALALAGLAVQVGRSYIGEQVALERERLQPRQPMVRIVVARQDLGRGEMVSAQTMAAREIPREYLAPGTVLPEQFESYAGLRLSAALRSGEPLLQTMLEGADLTTFATKVPAGVRAFTVMVDEVNSMSGMLQPGDRIDLLLSARPPATAELPAPVEITRTLLQDIRVLATGRQVRPGVEDKVARTYGAITVEVTPEQAQRLVVAQRIGRLAAMLRNPHDRAPVAHAPLDAWALLGLPPPRLPASPERGASRSTEILVGGQGALRAKPADVPVIAPGPVVPPVPPSSPAPSQPQPMGGSSSNPTTGPSASHGLSFSGRQP